MECREAPRPPPTPSPSQLAPKPGNGFEAKSHQSGVGIHWEASQCGVLAVLRGEAWFGGQEEEGRSALSCGRSVLM